MKKTKEGKIASLFLMLVMTVLFFGLNSQKVEAVANVWEYVGDRTFNGSGVSFTSIALNPSTDEPYVVYKDTTNGNKATVMKFNGTSWVNVGTAGFSTSSVSFTNIAFEPSTNEPYVVYMNADDGSGNKATVMKFNGASWVNVGTSDFSAGTAADTSIAFNPSTNEPYVAYIDYNSSNKATVMKFDGASWVNVGTAGFSANSVFYTNIAFNPSTNEPYVVYEEAGGVNKATVMKFDGASWVNVGTAGFSAGYSNYTSIAFNPSTNEAFVAYKDLSNGDKATAMKFDGASWVNVGTAGFSAGEADYTSIAFNPSTNEAYVAYEDIANLNKTTVMKFNGTSWVDVGTAGFSASSGAYTDIAFNLSSNEPYIAYQDIFGASVQKFNSNEVAIPTASPTAGTFSSTQNVTLSTTTPEAVIHYTTNGSNPTSGSTVYSGSISVSSSQTIKAIAIKSGMADSDVMSNAYAISTPTYRFLNLQDGDHFYTTDTNERDGLVANYSWLWQGEGTSYSVFSSQEANTTPVYRFLNLENGQHFYTIDASERDWLVSDYSWLWQGEGIAYYAYTSSQPESIPVYRFLNLDNGQHFFTTDTVERDWLISDYSWLWEGEGIAYYVPIDSL